MEKDILGYCQESGRIYTRADVYRGDGCFTRGEYVYCGCHKKRIVVEYPFVLSDKWRTKK